MDYNPITMPVLTARNRASFRHALLRWYDANRRDLPWRRTRDPYQIWISEIMLQQTRVAVVTDRYQRFLQRFPSVYALARADQGTVLAEWSGLGYYRRARNLHAAAQVVVRDLGGEFPHSADELRGLPGVGRYTAAAVASIAFGEAVTVVDGNVERVLARVLKAEVSGEQVWSSAQGLLDPLRPGDFNQAMMELGATICLPGQPECRECPVRKFCRTRGREQRGKRKTPQRLREIGYLLAKGRDSVLLVHRPTAVSLMPGMWELPEVRLGRSYRPLFLLRHSITITNYRVHVFEFRRGETERSLPRSRARWVKYSMLAKIPLTGLAAKILRRAGMI